MSLPYGFTVKALYLKNRCLPLISIIFIFLSLAYDISKKTNIYLLSMQYSYMTQIHLM